MPENQNHKSITFNQYIFLFMVLIFSPGIRFITGATIADAKQAAWLCAIMGVVWLSLIMIVLKQLMVNFMGLTYHEILCKVLGKLIGKILAVIVIVWLSMLLALYITYASDKLVSSIYRRSDMRLFIGIGLSFVTLAVYSGLAATARLGRIMFALINLVFVAILLLTLPYIDINNLSPISRLDVQPIFIGSLDFLAINVYITFCLCFNEKVIIDEHSNRQFIIAAVYTLLGGIIMPAATLGVFGAGMASQFMYPFLNLAKTLEATQIAIGLEGFVLSLWILSDYVLIIVLTYAILRMIRSVFALRSPLPFLGIFMVFEYLLAIFLCNDMYELTHFSRIIVAPVNLILGGGLVIVVYLVAKIRKMA